MDYRDWIIWTLLVITAGLVATITLSLIMHLAALETERLYTEDMAEARQFQRTCLEKNDARIELKELVDGWELTCCWKE